MDIDFLKKSSITSVIRVVHMIAHPWAAPLWRAVTEKTTWTTWTSRTSATWTTCQGK